MKIVVQRVTQASVHAPAENHHAEIGPGMLVLVGVERGDTERQADWLAAKTAQLRVFADDDENMNRSLLEVNGEALVVSQFTLAGDCRKGRRPSFARAAPPDEANTLYERYAESLRGEGVRRVVTGVFGAMMRVTLTNDGPVTFVLEHSPNA